MGYLLKMKMGTWTETQISPPAYALNTMDNMDA